MLAMTLCWRRLCCLAFFMYPVLSSAASVQHHPWNVIVCYSDSCPVNSNMTSFLRQNGHLSETELAAVECHFAASHGKDAALDLLDKDSRRVASLLALYAFLEAAFFQNADANTLGNSHSLTNSGDCQIPTHGDRYWETVSYNYLPRLNIEIIADPQRRVDAATLRLMARKLPCLCFEPEMDVESLPARDVKVDTHGKDRRQLSNDVRIDVAAHANDPLVGHQWHLTFSKVFEAWETFTGASKGMTIASLDFGASFHPDLAQNLWKNPDISKCQSADFDHPSREPGCYGWDMSLGWHDFLPPPYNYISHGNPLTEKAYVGTATASVMASTANNGLLLAGVCWGCKVVILKIVNAEGRSYLSYRLKAYEFILVNNIKISFFDWGGHINRPLEAQHLKELSDAGHLMVVSAGNNNCDVDGGYTSPYPCRTQEGDYIDAVTPGAYPFDNILNVGSINKEGRMSHFSNWGNASVDLFAPGEDLEVLWNTHDVEHDYMPTKVVSGTAFASSFVAGAAALVWGANPSWTAQQVKQHLMSTSMKTDAFKGKCVSGGIVDVAKAVANGSVLDPPTKPLPTPTKDFTYLFYEKALSDSSTYSAKPSFVLLLGVLSSLVSLAFGCSMTT